MKKYRDLSVKVKAPVMMGMASFTVLALVCLALLVPLRNTSLEDSSKIAELLASNSGERLAVTINGAADVLRAYSGVIANMIASDLIPHEKMRNYLLGSMEMMLQREEKLHDLWCMFEPNLLDGMDSLFIHHTGSNSQGVFAPWLIGGKLTVIENRDDADLYYLTKKTKQEMISKPYWTEMNGKKIHVFSVVVPIFVHDSFIGVLGTDFEVSEMYHMIASLSGNTVGKLVSNDGIVTVHREPECIGILTDSGNREIIDRFADGKMFKGFYQFEGQELFKVFVPIHLGEGNAPWFYAVDIPVKDIYATSRTTAAYLIAYCLAGVALIALAGWGLTKNILKDVISVTDIIRQLSSGRINLHIDEQQKSDEIGVMKNELRRLVEGLNRTAGFAHNIGEGNLNADYRLLSADDALGASLLEMRQSLQDAEKEHSLRAREEEQRNWGTSGLAKFAEILRRNNDNMEVLSYNIISNMVKYLDANQGGIFVLNEAEFEEEKLLEMTACYAFDRKKFAEKQIHLGEGLVGTCYLEGETIYMTDIPDEYVTITSGLGDANPRALLICPLKVNDEIFGVIELASFREFEPYQLDFVQKLSESIAATISSVRVNIRTERLLSQTQLQTEEMANVEEELRQNMEEMQATQEDMRRREIELSETLTKMQEMQAAGEEKEYEMQQFYNTIFETCNVVEFSTEAVITNVNQNLLSIFNNADRDTFVGKCASDFIGEEASETAWSYLSKGKFYEDVQTVNTGAETLVIRQKFVPICNKQGQLKRVFLLALPENGRG